MKLLLLILSHSYLLLRRVFSEPLVSFSLDHLSTSRLFFSTYILGTMKSPWKSWVENIHQPRFLNDWMEHSSPTPSAHPEQLLVTDINRKQMTIVLGCCALLCHFVTVGSTTPIHSACPLPFTSEPPLGLPHVDKH